MRRLKNRLFLLPSFVIFSSFLILVLAFPWAFGLYVEQEASKHILKWKESLDTYYENGKYEGFYAQESEFIIQVHYCILDAQGNLVYPRRDWAEEAEWERNVQIASQIQGWSEEEGRGRSLFLGDQVYYLRTYTYQGEFDDFFITQSKGNNYKVGIYINITLLHNFLKMANKILLVLGLALGCFSLLAIWMMARGLDRSFAILGERIRQLGSGQAGEMEAPGMAYAEFAQALEVVQRMAAKIQKNQESQKQFFQNASHELRTPLMAIQGYGEGLKSGVIKNVAQSAEIIIRHSQRMASLVDEILFLSKMDSGREEMAWEELDIKELLYELSWYMQDQSAQGGIDIQHAFPKERILVWGDERLLERAISNLLSNGKRYARESLLLEAETAEGWLRVSIIDDGEGIDTKDLPHIFERFYKGRGGQFWHRPGHSQGDRADARRRVGGPFPKGQDGICALAALG